MAEELHLVLPLLNDSDNDEEILSQLLSTERERGSGRRCHFQLTRKRCSAISFALMVFFGFISSIWAAASCNLVLVDWNPGGVELTIEAVGLWRFAQKATNGTHTKHSCVSYDRLKAHKETNLDSFFPKDKALQAYSIVSPSTAFASILALMVCLVEVTVYPEILSGTTSPESAEPKTAIKAAVIAGGLLIIGGIFQMVSIFSLLHYDYPISTTTGYQSPICNPSFSHCRLGPMGVWGVFGALALIFAGIISFYYARRVAHTHGKWKRIC